MVIKVKTSKSKSINVKTQIALADNLCVINNVDISQVQDGYVLMYDDVRKTYKFVDPDEVLKGSVADGVLPPEFVDKLDQDLDDRIDLDAGEF